MPPSWSLEFGWGKRFCGSLKATRVDHVNILTNLNVFDLTSQTGSLYTVTAGEPFNYGSPDPYGYVEEFKDVFGTPPKVAESTSTGVTHRIDLEGSPKPHFRNPPRLAPPELAELSKQLKALLEAGYIKPTVSP